MRSWWPRRLHASAPASASAWTRRTDWKSTKGYTIDYKLAGDGLRVSDYDTGKVRELLTDHAPMTARISRSGICSSSRTRRAPRHPPTPAQRQRRSAARAAPHGRDAATAAQRLNAWVVWDWGSEIPLFCRRRFRWGTAGANATSACFALWINLPAMHQQMSPRFFGFIPTGTRCETHSHRYWAASCSYGVSAWCLGVRRHSYVKRDACIVRCVRCFVSACCMHMWRQSSHIRALYSDCPG